MTSSPLAAPNGARSRRLVVGAQRPRILAVPAFVSSAGQEAIDLAAMAGVILDDWQQFVLINALGERIDGRWSAFEVGVAVSRQNGKGEILLARQLSGLYLFDERLIVHSAHQFDTSLEAFRRLEAVIEGSDEFSKRVKRISRSHGEEGIELYGPKGRRVTGGQRIRFRTRTKGGGRGFTGDCVLLDEAMILPESARSAILPIVSARPNPQVWYTGSAVDRLIHEDGIVFAQVRERGISGDDPALAYFEWSIEPPLDEMGKPLSPDDLPAAFTADPKNWAQANPALGIRISEEHVANEWRSMGGGGRSFAVERLGHGDWPRSDGEVYVISPEVWADLTDKASTPTDPVAFAFDITPDRARGAIGVAGHRADGLPHLEVIEHRAGTGWIVERVADLVVKHRPSCVVCDGRSPAASLVPELAALGVEITVTNAGEHAQACGMFYDAVENRSARHRGTPELIAAIRGAAKRPLGDAWAWDRKHSDSDIAPLVTVTLALWGLIGTQVATPWADGW